MKELYISPEVQIVSFVPAHDVALESLDVSLNSSGSGALSVEPPTFNPDTDFETP